MKNSIMKKTWGILLGFGVSLATAAFVLTGCDIEVKEKETSLDTALVAKWYYGGTGNDAATVGQTAANNGTETYLIFEFTGIASASGGDWAFITGNSSSGKVTGSYSRADNEITLYSSGGSYLGYLKYTVSGTVLTLTNASNDGVKTFEGTYYKAAASSGTVATPTASPAEGAVASGTTVALSTTTTGASIRYTTDSTTPTSTTGTVYSDPIPITAATTIKAIAYKSGMTDSAVATFAYTISSTGGTTATIQDLVTALGADNVTLDEAAKTVTLKTNVSMTATGKGFTIPEDVKLITGNSYTLTLGGGNTYTINGTLQTGGGRLVVNGSSKITITGTGTIEKTNTSSTVLTVSGQTVEINGVTVKGYAGSANAAIGVSAGSLTFIGGGVTGNTGCSSTSGGAGIRISGTGTVTLDGGAKVYGNSMTQNSAKGAGVYLDGGTLNIKNGSTVYGYSTWGESYKEAEEADIYVTEGANANSVPSVTTAYGSAIYWASGATVNVPKTGGALENILTAWDALDKDDQDKFRYIESNASDHYTDFTIHTDANQWWNIAAR